MKFLENDLKRIYKFGGSSADGNADMKTLLGGKGANLAEMSKMGIPVPPGFTITTSVCTAYDQYGASNIHLMLEDELFDGLQFIENVMGTRFGDPSNPCLLSVRSGARKSMPGMMDTILNIGLNDESVIGLARKAGKEKFAWDS